MTATSGKRLILTTVVDDVHRLKRRRSALVSAKRSVQRLKSLYYQISVVLLRWSRSWDTWTRDVARVRALRILNTPYVCLLVCEVQSKAG